MLSLHATTYATHALMTSTVDWQAVRTATLSRSRQQPHLRASAAAHGGHGVARHPAAAGRRHPFLRLQWAGQPDSKSPDAAGSKLAICTSALLMTVVPVALQPHTARRMQSRCMSCSKTVLSCFNAEALTADSMPARWSCVSHAADAQRFEGRIPTGAVVTVAANQLLPVCFLSHPLLVLVPGLPIWRNTYDKVCSRCSECSWQARTRRVERH